MKLLDYLRSLFGRKNHFELKKVDELDGWMTKYDVILKKEYTVKEFIEEALSRKEVKNLSGRVVLTNIETKYKVILLHENGKIKPAFEKWPDHVLSRKVVSVMCEDKYGLYDYYVTIEGRKENESKT